MEFLKKYWPALIIIVFLYFLMTWNTSNQEGYLYGFWLADGDEFCDKSDISSILLFIGESEGFWKKTRPCYLVIMNDMCNQGLNLTYKTGWASPSIGEYYIRARAEFDDEQIWPEYVNIRMNMLDGTIVIEEDDVVYAKLLKQHDTTNIAAANKN